MPIGYKVVNGKIIICEEHRKIVEEIFRDYDSGVSTLRIAKGLKAGGICNAHGRVAWTHASIGRILENHNYLGTGYYPQIIDRELFERVQNRREQVRMETGRGCHRPGRDGRILFGGIITCGGCGEKYSRIQPRSRKKSGIMAEWKCKNYIYHNRLSCAGGFISDAQVKEVCVSAINQIIQDRKLIRLSVSSLKEGMVSMECRKAERRLEQAKQELSEQGTDQPDIMALLYERAQERYRTLEINDAGFLTDEMEEILTEKTELAEFDEELYRKLVKKIVIYKDNTAEVVFLNGSSIRTGYQ